MKIQIIILALIASIAVVLGGALVASKKIGRYVRRKPCFRSVRDSSWLLFF
ncbi:MAG: hypothetical protein WAV76_12430 [Bacteroidota bacterium]